LSDDNFAPATKIVHDEFAKHRPDVLVGSSRGGGVAMSIERFIGKSAKNVSANFLKQMLK
jgi:hypothetical protein